MCLENFRVKLFDVNEQESHQIVRHCPHSLLSNACTNFLNTIIICSLPKMFLLFSLS